MWLIGGDTFPFISYSYNGIDWDSSLVTATAPPGNLINGITWDGNKWIAVGDTTTIYYSYNGFEWTLSTIVPPIGDVGPLYAVAWNRNLGYTYIQQPVISLGISRRDNSIAYSLDGIKYTGLGNFQNGLLNQGYAAAWNGSMWVATGNGNNTIIYSYDGIEWISIFGSNAYISPAYAVVWTGINWVVTGYNGSTTYVYYSTNGINWTPSTTPGSTGVCYGLATDVKTIVGGTQSTTVAVGNINNPGIIYSVNDGVNWTQATFPLPPVSTLYCVAWNGTTWLTGGDNSNGLYSSLVGINGWNSALIAVGSIVTIRSIAWNGIVWVVVGDNFAGAIQIYYTTVLNGQSGWTLATIVPTGTLSVNLRSVIWNGKRWITGGQDKNTNISYIFTSHDGITWYESPPVTTPPNPYVNPLKEAVYGLASNSRIGGVIVDSQIALNKTNSVRLTTKLDLYSDDYYNNGYNNMTASIKSTDLL